MSTSILDIKDAFMSNVKSQRTPINYDDSDYLRFAMAGTQRFFTDCGNESKWDAEYSYDATPVLNSTLNILQFSYCVTASEIEFFQSVRNNWNTLVSYTTNALSVAYAYKPFEFLTQTIADREAQLTYMFHQMTES